MSFRDGRRKPTLMIGVTVDDARIHNCSRHRAPNWIHSRIWRSRDYLLSAPPTCKATIVPFVRDSVYRTTRAVSRKGCSVPKPVRLASNFGTSLRCGSIFFSVQHIAGFEELTPSGEGAAALPANGHGARSAPELGEFDALQLERISKPATVQ